MGKGGVTDALCQGEEACPGLGAPPLFFVKITLLGLRQASVGNKSVFLQHDQKDKAMKILAVGMNYAEHNKGPDGTLCERGEPVIFAKPDSALLKDGKPFFIPDFTRECDYGAGLVIRVCRLGKNIASRFAWRYYDAVTVGIDFTARDLQRKLRKEGLPWELCKGFDGSAVIGDFVSKEELPDMRQIAFRLEIDGRTVQEGCSGDMLFAVDELVAYVSRFYTLKTGDLLFTGTPPGAGTVAVGQRLRGYVRERKVLDFNVR